MLSLLQRGRQRARLERVAFTLYSASVRAAREPWNYQAPPDGLGVPDTMDGRFDLIALYAFLVIRRLRAMDAPGPDIAQGVFDAMFSDMDRNLSELGVSDLAVGKRVRAMWEAFHGRAVAYEAALEGAGADGGAALAAALERNVWRSGPAAPGAPATLGRIVRAQIAVLDRAAVLEGEAEFLPAREAAA